MGSVLLANTDDSRLSGVSWPHPSALGGIPDVQGIRAHDDAQRATAVTGNLQMQAVQKHLRGTGSRAGML